MILVQIQDFINQVRGKLIVSCQALPGTPLDDPYILAAIAKAVEIKVPQPFELTAPRT